MFKISPIQDEKLQKEYLEACGSTLREGYFAYAMKDEETGELMGVSQFEINGEEGYIADLREAPGRGDFEAMFILARQTMNFIDSCGAHTCYAAEDAGEERLMRAAGFKKQENGEYFRDMTGMFDGKCDGHEVKLEG